MTLFASCTLVGLTLGLGNLSTAICVARQAMAGRCTHHFLIWHGLMQSICPVLGFILGTVLAPSIGLSAKVAIGALLVLSALEHLLQTRDVTEPRASERARRAPSRLRMAVVNSCARNIAIGFALGLLPLPLMLAGGVIATAGIFVSLAGLELWSGLGRRAEVGIAVASAVGLMLLALAVA